MAFIYQIPHGMHAMPLSIDCGIMLYTSDRFATEERIIPPPADATMECSERNALMDTLTKTCTKCGETKPTSEFYKRPDRKNGLRSRCKACELTCHSDWYADHHEEMLAYNANYRSEHHEERAAYYASHREEFASYRADHREKNMAYAASYYAEHRQEIIGKAAAYRIKHREEIASWRKANLDKSRANYHRRRARKLSNGGTHTAQDVQRQGDCQKWLCWWCGKYCAEKYDVDHLVPLKRGGHNWPSNIVISCPHCNRSKQDKTPDEWVGRLL